MAAMTDSKERTELAACVQAMHGSGQPQPLYRAIEVALGRLIGHKLFTLMCVVPSGDRVRRLYSSNPAAYPVGGFKAMQGRPWGRHVLAGRQSYVGRNADDIRWAFPDHELIASLGLASVLNQPVVYDGRCLGTMNLLDVAGHYDLAHAEVAALFAALLVPALSAAVAEG
jgi:GAF domain-containing protein